jgi:AraC-like DNA-binding protein
VRDEDASGAVLEVALAAQLVRPLKARRAVAVAIEALMPRARADAAGTPGVCVGDLARHIGLSQRRLIELFSAEVGMTPKLFARVRRFQRAIAMVGQVTTPDWAGVALVCNYYDQSHLIRDFRAFCGLSPGEYLRQRSPLVKEHHIPLSNA